MTHRILAVTALLTCALSAQQRVDPRNTYQRLLCIVPMVGTGTPDDPRRPDHVQLPTRGSAQAVGSAIAFNYQISDDGQYALVEFVAKDRSAFQGILADHRSTVKVFEKGKDRRQDIEQEFKKYKKAFDISNFGMIVP